MGKDTYVRGSANYGFDAYTAGFSITAGSNLEIADTSHPSLSWLVGDTVLGVGGQFVNTAPTDAGWTSFSGEAVNALLPSVSPYTGPKLQVKFGTAAATWTASTVAPGAGNGQGGSSNGGGRVQVRTSAYFQIGTPTSGQTEPWTWDGNSGEVLALDKDNHILWESAPVTPSKYSARMIWQWDDTLQRINSWELLLNVSLLSRQEPGSFSGLLPAIGDLAILTVQNGEGAYTDALVEIAAASPARLANTPYFEVPEPSSVTLIGLGLAVVSFNRRRRGLG